MATGTMHAIKETLHPGDKHIDVEYDTAITRYNELDRLTRTVKEAATNFCNAHRTTLANSNIASRSFASILDDPLSETGFETLSKQMLLAHSQLDGDRQSALTQRMSEGVLVPLEKLHLHLLDLNTKSTKRDELHKNLQYYLGKVGQLLRDREERSLKGKVESDSQKDKLTRNQLKLDTVRQQYTQYTQPLIVELSSVWNTRVNYIGPVLAAFASVEKEFASVYSKALDEVHTDVVESAQAKKLNNIPSVEGSSLNAPMGLDGTPIHTMQVGTVDATQAMLVQKAQDPSAINVSSTSGLPRMENALLGKSSTPTHATSVVAPLINDSTTITAHGTTSAPLDSTSGELLHQAAPSKKTQAAAVQNAAQSQVTEPGVIVTDKDANSAIKERQREEQRKEDEIKRVQREQEQLREQQEKERQRLLQEQNSSITLASNPSSLNTTTSTLNSTTPITTMPVPVAVPAVATTTVTTAAPLNATTQPIAVATTTTKSLHEDESKQQRFEQDQKTAQIL